MVVIAIIGILVGILMPVVAGLKKKAKTRQAEMEVRDIATAIRAYHTEYKQWPIPIAGNPDIGGVWSNNNHQVLSLLLAAGNLHNRNFYEMANPATPMCDPAGTTSWYRITIDVTNNSVTVSSPGYGVSQKY